MAAERWETLIQKESERQSELRTFMSRGSRDNAHWKWERIRVVSDEIRSLALSSCSSRTKESTDGSRCSRTESNHQL
jgi:hypothetical protein